MRLVNFDTALLTKSPQNRMGVAILGQPINPKIPNCVNFKIMTDDGLETMRYICANDCLSDCWELNSGNTASNLIYRFDWRHKGYKNLHTGWSILQTHNYVEGQGFQKRQIEFYLTQEQWSNSKVIAAGCFDNGEIGALLLVPSDVIMLVSGVLVSVRTGNVSTVLNPQALIQQKNDKYVKEGKGALQVRHINDFIWRAIS